MDTTPTLDQIQWMTPPLVSPLKNPALDQEVKKALGMIPTMMPYLYSNPVFVRVGIAAQQYYPLHLPGDLGPLIHLVVSQDNSCRYCYGAVRSMLKLLGYQEEYIRQLEQELTLIELEPAQKKALEISRKISRTNPRPGSIDLKDLERAGLSRVAVKEIVVEASLTCYSNRLATCLAVPPDAIEKMEKNFIMKIFRPLIAKKMRSGMKPNLVQKEHSGPYVGPCAELLDLLKDLPAAASLLRTILEAAWSSQAIPRRTKAMMVAVVSRSSGCQSSEAAACRVLEAEGFSPADIQQMLTQLSSDKLTPLERKLLPLARETVRYRPQEIQQKFREAAAGEPDAVIVEIVVTAALANLVSRLSLLQHLN